MEYRPEYHANRLDHSLLRHHRRHPDHLVVVYREYIAIPLLDPRNHRRPDHHQRRGFNQRLPPGSADRRRQRDGEGQ